MPGLSNKYVLNISISTVRTNAASNANEPIHACGSIAYPPRNNKHSNADKRNDTENINIRSSMKRTLAEMIVTNRVEKLWTTDEYAPKQDLNRRSVGADTSARSEAKFSMTLNPCSRRLPGWVPEGGDLP